MSGPLPREGFEAIPCPVCGGENFKPLFEKAGEPFVRCAGCSLVLINPRPRFEALEHTYDAHYSRGYIDKAEKKLARCRRWVARIRRRLGHCGNWLDVGCSAGFVMAAAEAAGFAAWGVELEPAAVEFGRIELGLERIVCGTFEAQAYPSAFFDVVSMYDVIEHVPDLNAAVAELARVLKPGGLIEIRTPDVSHWARPRELSNWKEIKPSEHLYYFSPETLTRFFARHGLREVHRRVMFKAAIDALYAHA